MWIPALHDHDAFHENDLEEFLLERLDINHDGGVYFVGGGVHHNGLIDEINTPVYGKADAKASSIYFHSCIKPGTPGYVPIPYSIIIIVNSDGQVVDLKCSTCLQPKCHCDV